MKLTGKCKNDFENWNLNRSLNVTNQERKNKVLIEELKPFAYQVWNFDEPYLNALIIEFFDSVGIYIHIEPYVDFDYNTLFKNYILFNKNINEQNSYIYRQEAANAAIEKANEIFNQE